mgnify:CR=1 FL=1
MTKMNEVVFTDDEAVEKPEERTDLVERKPEEEKPQSRFRDYSRYLLGAALGVLAACLFLWLGFWRTALILGMAGLGAFVFGVKDKTERLKTLVNRLFPPRS